MIAALLTATLMLSSCERYEPVALSSTEELATEAPSKTEPESTEAPAETEPIETEPPKPVDTRKHVEAKGIYLAYAPVNNESFMDRIIEVMDETELNAVVIDVKDDYGRITYDMQGVPLVDELGASSGAIEDLPGVISELKAHGIYCIARIVALKDPFIAEAKPEWALYKGDGSVFRDNAGDAWVNPYKTEYWDYLLDVSKAAGEIGFDEIQFDYIRFSTDGGMRHVDFGPEAEVQDKEAVITEFTEYACERLHELGVPVSADVYGIVIDSELDASLVGQNYYEMSKYLDYISPMVYPSHYGPGNLGLAVPDAQPYETIYRSMSASRRVLAGWTLPEEAAVSGNEVSGNGVSGNGVPQQTAEGELQGAEEIPEELLPDPKELTPAEEIRAQVRPWLQDFTATWVNGHISYGPEEIRAQIQGVYDAGYEEWILWNAANRYTEGGLLAEEEGA